MAKNETSKAFASGLGQFNYPNLLEPVLKDKKKPDGPVVYNTMFFFEKDGKTSKALKKQIDAHVAEIFPEGVDEDFPMPIKDGTKMADKYDKKQKREGKEEKVGGYDYLRGMEVINPWTNAGEDPMQLLDGQNPAPKDESKCKKMFRSGFKGYVFLKANVYNYEGKEGCNLYLEGAQYRENGTIEGQSSGGRTDVSSLAVNAPGSEEEDAPDADLDDL